MNADTKRPPGTGAGRSGMRRRELVLGVLPLLGLSPRMAAAMAAGSARVSAGGVSRPIVIAHRGASARRPEHTLAAYRLAIEEGADFIEPDLVVTRDGVLIARHENALSGSTDVASRPEFSGRRTTKVIDGQTVTDWFAEDFTLAEIKRLRAREPMPEVRPGSAAFDGRFQVPTLAEIIALVRSVDAAGGPWVGIYPETKHPTFFAREGRHRNGRPIGVDLGELLVDTLKAEGFTHPARVFIQSFELANLIDLKRRVLPAAGLDLALIQLFGDTGERFVNDGGGGFSRPYDVGYHGRRGDDLAAIYGPDLAALLGPDPGYGALTHREALGLVARYARGLGAWTASLLPREALESPVDADGDGRAGITTRLTGEVSPLAARARAAGLLVHAYTLRPEEPFRSLDAQDRVLSMAGEIAALVATGVDGLFCDDPAGAVRAVGEALGAG